VSDYEDDDVREARALADDAYRRAMAAEQAIRDAVPDLVVAAARAWAEWHRLDDHARSVWASAIDRPSGPSARRVAKEKR
jgi:hypothetical protein